MNTKVISDRIVAILRRCENALSPSEDPYIQENAERLKRNLDEISQAFSGSWLGYHANVYYRDLKKPAAGDYTDDEIRDAAHAGVDPNFENRLEQAFDQVSAVCEEGRDGLLTIIDVLLDQERTSTLERIRSEVTEIRHQTSANKIVNTLMPGGKSISRDMRAISQGTRVPPHCAMQAEQISLFSPFTGLKNLIKKCKSILNYMEIHDMIDKDAVARGERVFIGHGRSPLWRELKDFLQDRLGLPWEEFNRQPTAGQATTERLDAMLNSSCFAFLVMTAEDEHSDKSLHARENVIHEAGLFQGRLGFKKAIILLEADCPEFSNIIGLSQIRFPKGKISAVFEDVRRVLEREKII
jgi:predicted nucleotide-binding protein